MANVGLVGREHGGNIPKWDRPKYELEIAWGSNLQPRKRTMATGEAIWRPPGSYCDDRGALFNRRGPWGNLRLPRKLVAMVEERFATGEALKAICEHRGSSLRRSRKRPATGEALCTTLLTLCEHSICVHYEAYRTTSDLLTPTFDMLIHTPAALWPTLRTLYDKLWWSISTRTGITLCVWKNKTPLRASPPWSPTVTPMLPSAARCSSSSPPWPIQCSLGGRLRQPSSLERQVAVWVLWVFSTQGA